MNAKKLLANCRARIAPHVHNTPVMRSRQLNERAGADVWLKCENFQRMGAFKMRGAVNAALSLPMDARQRGLVTHSSGNFAQALALAAQSIGVPATIVMPSNAPEVKKAAVRGYGGKIVECEPIVDARQRETDRIVAETGATFIHPSDDLDVIVGQGTAAAELLEAQQGLECLFAPVGGGGLIAGTVLAAEAHAKPVTVFGAEPWNVDDAFRSLASGVIQDNSAGADTIADGLKTLLGETNFPIMQRGVSCILRVSEAEIVDAMKFVWERTKLVIEPSAAVAVAALFQPNHPCQQKRIGVILSGGNVDLGDLPF